MISLAPGTKVYLASKPVSMRLAFDGLAALVRPLFAIEPYCGHVFELMGWMPPSVHKRLSDIVCDLIN